MICQLCRKKEVRRLRIEKNVEIFECSDCQFGFLDAKNTILGRSTQDGNKGNKSRLYDFKSYKKEEKKLRKRFDRLVKIILKYKSSGNVLDIGAGFGLYSSMLQKTGKYSVEIIEPNVRYRYIDIRISAKYKTAFEKFKSKGKKYDVILMLDVLEHFRDPLTNLRKAKSLLKKDGVLVIQTPNYKSLMALICRDWSWWMVEDHKFFFSPRSLKLLLEKAGFETEHFTTYEDLADFRKNLDGNFRIIENSIFRKVLKGIFLTMFMPVYFLTRRVIWKLNFGGLLFVLAKKS